MAGTVGFEAGASELVGVSAEPGASFWSLAWGRYT